MKERDWFYTIIGTLIIITGIFMVLIAIEIGLYIWTVPLGVGGITLCMIGVMISLMEKPSEVEWECPYCKQKFQMLSFLELHMKIECKEKKTEC